LLSKSDAYLIPETMIRGRLVPGSRISAPKWQPIPLPNIDGPPNPSDQVSYGAISLANASDFRAGTYSLYLQLWNNARLIVPEAQETPTNFKVFTFTIAQGPKIEPVDCSLPDAQFPKVLTNAEDNLTAVLNEVQALSDVSAPGTTETLRRYRATVDENVEKVNQTSTEANSR
jgi:hypothetical protein